LEFQLTRALGDELVVLDARSKVAHHLDAAASAVWRASDGDAGVEQIAERTGLPAERVGELVAQLCAAGVLADGSELDEAAAEEGAGQTRRLVLGRMVTTGLGLGVGLPAITSMVLPTPAQAFSSVGGTGDTGGGTTPGTTTFPAPPQVTPISTSKNTGSRAPGTAHGGGTRTGTSPASGTSGGGSGGLGPSGEFVSLSKKKGAAARTLPFTGDNLVRQAEIATGAVAAGAALRRAAKLKSPQPQPEPQAD
jgi:hypothetical protein